MGRWMDGVRTSRSASQAAGRLDSRGCAQSAATLQEDVEIVLRLSQADCDVVRCDEVCEACEVGVACVARSRDQKINWRRIPKNSGIPKPSR